MVPPCVKPHAARWAARGAGSERKASAERADNDLAASPRRRRLAAGGADEPGGRSRRSSLPLP